MSVLSVSRKCENVNTYREIFAGVPAPAERRRNELLNSERII